VRSEKQGRDPCSEVLQVVKRLEERVAAIEGMLEMLMSEQRGETRRRPGTTLVDEIRRRVYIPVNEIRSRSLLRRLIESGEVVLLRDEGANREVVTLKEVIRRVLGKLPLRQEEAAKLDEREYELLQMLNRLGYVLLRDGSYVKTELAREFEV